MMPTTALQRTNAVLESHRLLLAVLVLAVGATVLAVPVVADGPDAEHDHEADRFGFADGQLSIEVDPGETVEIDVTNTGGDMFVFELDHVGDDLHLEVELEPTAENVTIELATGTVGEDPTESLSAADAEVRNVTVHENDIDGELPGGSYGVSVDDGDGYHAGTLLAEPTVRFETSGTISDSDSEHDPVETFEGTTGLESGEPLEVRLESRDDGSPLFETETVVDDDGAFEVALDLSHVPEDAWLSLVAEHDGTVKAEVPVIVEDDVTGEDERKQESHGIVIVYEDEMLELEAAPGQAITGEAALEAGETVDVRLESTDGTPFLVSETATVDDRGTFEANIDLDIVEPGTEFEVIASARGEPRVNGTAPGIVLEPVDGGSHTPATEQSADLDDNASLLGTASGLRGLGAIAFGTVLASVGIAVIVGVRRDGLPGLGSS
ncbi:hypothetical protein D8Y22_07085 [Salinadaptatus halalkaliphilus]|uniref:Uncharacterized protein n=1 Tax=Salinadaptatus halalkaliphilus TaxID=2419781 RepID=A0A4S3TMV1_9EURY|nr:BGTF surface domain-containing protein [Salinadaptatus halalkaliphilus]THE65571.1 hypothetical protein D8Y22_07085 [Salinadaptatus halalkaliphilus]